jgi:hypothetical protein
MLPLDERFHPASIIPSLQTVKPFGRSVPIGEFEDDDEFCRIVALQFLESLQEIC